MLFLPSSNIHIVYIQSLICTEFGPRPWSPQPPQPQLNATRKRRIGNLIHTIALWDERYST